MVKNKTIEKRKRKPTSYLKLEEKEMEMMEKIQKITETDYDIKDDFINADNLIVALEDLFHQYNEKEHEIKELKNDIEQNYELKKFNPYEEYGVSEKDFY